MRITGLVALLVLGLAVTGCGKVEPGSYQAFDVGKQGGGTSADLSGANGIWTGTLTPPGGGVGTSVTAILWQGNLLVLSPGSDRAYAGRLTRTSGPTQLTNQHTTQSPFQQNTTTSSPGSGSSANFVPNQNNLLTNNAGQSSNLMQSPNLFPSTDQNLGPNFTTNSDFGSNQGPATTSPSTTQTLGAGGEIRAYSLAGEPLGNGRVTGSIVPQGSLDATISGTSVEGTLNLGLSSLFSREILLTDLEGSWSTTRNNRTVTLTLDRSGSLTGSSTDGCIYSGSLELLRRGVNLFRTTLTIDNCAANNGRYAGYAFLNPWGVGTTTAVPALWVLAESDQQDGLFAATLQK
ncbi:MAG TPA: hypothetical protein VKA48_00745 [Gammaproteobacteria bacterium]|nr:hypothetical protein [Gammaproteobacteria bacterium]